MDELDAYFKRLQCVRRALRGVNINAATLATECHCFPTCDEYIYIRTISASQWPAHRQYENFYESYVLNRDDRHRLKAYQMLGDVIKTNQTFAEKELMYQGVARLNVYFGTSDVLMSQENASFSLAALISDIGGSLGFWLGMSLLSVIEFLHFFIRLSALAVRKTVTATRTTQPS